MAYTEGRYASHSRQSKQSRLIGPAEWCWSYPLLVMFVGLVQKKGTPDERVNINLTAVEYALAEFILVGK
jgi:hypothetical protein